jgi:hypothetical protein
MDFLPEMHGLYACNACSGLGLSHETPHRRPALGANPRQAMFPGMGKDELTHGTQA